MVVAGKEKPKALRGKRPTVDVAILLDTSNSMDGLIDQAKSQLWNIVEEFGNAKKGGKSPALRVSIFEYGNSNLPANEGYIRQVVQLTDDLDKVSEALFSLKTSGGDEYCGMVIGEALKRLDWSEKRNAYKAIFIAGNEPFTQGEVDYEVTCKSAISQGVVVNTIHCGEYAQGISGKWKAGADLAEGDYLNIDQDKKVVAIKTPHDKVIIELNSKLNKTYLWYGTEGKRRGYAENQMRQDGNAIQQGNFSKRFQSKASSVYSNRGRDLVDSFGELEESERDERLSGIEKSELPEQLQGMSVAERSKFIEDMTQKRVAIQKEIAAASRLQADYIRQHKTKMTGASGEESTLGGAMNKSIRAQLKASGFDLAK